MRIEGNKRSSLLRALDIFLYDRSCVFCERTLARFLDAAFRERGGRDAENDGGGGGGGRKKILRGGKTGRAVNGCA